MFTTTNLELHHPFTIYVKPLLLKIFLSSFSLCYYQYLGNKFPQ